MGFSRWNTCRISPIAPHENTQVKRWNTWNTFSGLVGTEHPKNVKPRRRKSRCLSGTRSRCISDLFIALASLVIALSAARRRCAPAVAFAQQEHQPQARSVGGLRLGASRCRVAQQPIEEVLHRTGFGKCFEHLRFRGFSGVGPHFRGLAQNRSVRAVEGPYKRCAARRLAW